jgi:hypothetical protein
LASRFKGLASGKTRLASIGENIGKPPGKKLVEIQVKRSWARVKIELASRLKTRLASSKNEVEFQVKRAMLQSK